MNADVARLKAELRSLHKTDDGKTGSIGFMPLDVCWEAADALDALAARSAAVRELVTVKWELDMATYPADNAYAEFARAAVRCCQREVLAALNNGEAERGEEGEA